MPSTSDSPAERDDKAHALKKKKELDAARLAAELRRFRIEVRVGYIIAIILAVVAVYLATR